MSEPVIDLLENLDAESTGRRRLLPLPWSATNHGLGGGLPEESMAILAGSIAAGKSYAAAQTALTADVKGWRWAYFPLEKTRQYALRRFLAAHSGSWRHLDPAHAPETRVLAEQENTFAWLARIGENILTPEDHQAEAVFAMIEAAASQKDLIIVDPITAIDFGDARDPWRVQSDFVKRLSALASRTHCRILACHHLRKAFPGATGRPSGLDDLAGSSGISRWADNVLILENHEETESEIIGEFGIPQMVRHKKTMTLAKCRDGRGTGWRLAFDFSETAPELLERGVIRVKPKGRK